MLSRIGAVAIVALLLFSLSPQLVQPTFTASAETNCDGGDFVTPKWNKTVERMAKIPGVYSDNYFDEDRRGKDGNAPQVEENQSEEYDGPEENWMTWNPQYDLSLLREDFQTSILVGEDAVGVLKINLDYQRRTTFCINFEGLNNSIEPTADVYLLTQNQYDMYSVAYDIMHGAWWEKTDRNDDDQLSEIPPEWRSFTVAGWTSFRDSHDYENVKQTSFSVILDTPEISTSLFGSTETQYFHLVIDNTNNSRDNDAVPVDTIAAYISIVSDERTTILPPWTVSLVCCALSIGLFAVPVILNKKYMSYGVSLVGKSTQIEKQLVPTMEQNQQSISTQEESTHLEDHEH